ncbi:hypothetical protein TCON_0410 [Astathelohania contejeani]|uniref:Uncharacterized protein n=1 Tax=Astathelohania contejeani TaxID=164912 RepID=A0ABQ7I1Q8_9MICR|nr:hypothetical protein TCON_0410 [Thelohania contejeani]
MIKNLIRIITTINTVHSSLHNLNNDASDDIRRNESKINNKDFYSYNLCKTNPIHYNKQETLDFLIKEEVSYIEEIFAVENRLLNDDQSNVLNGYISEKYAINEHNDLFKKNESNGHMAYEDFIVPENSVISATFNSNESTSSSITQSSKLSNLNENINITMPNDTINHGLIEQLPIGIQKQSISIELICSVVNKEIETLILFMNIKNIYKKVIQDIDSISNPLSFNKYNCYNSMLIWKNTLKDRNKFMKHLDVNTGISL